MPLFRGKAEAKLIERGLDPARLPPGQYLTEKWPVLHAGSVPHVDLATWTFRVSGEVENPTERSVVAHAEQGFTANLPLAALEEETSLVAWEADGEPLTPDHGWPLRLVVPTRYFWKSAKWLRGLELRTTDQPGFWERYGYHNDADFWKEERYGF